MASRTRVRTFRGQAPRRSTEWFASVDSTAVATLAAATKVLDQSLTAAELAKLPFTVVRVRGSVWVNSDQTAGDEQQLLGVGFGVFSDTAVAAGIASLPDPISNEADDLWFVHRFAFSSVNVDGGALGIVTEFDSRAMRKVQEGSDIGVILANGSAAAGLQFWLKFRMLVKLH